MPLNPKHQVLGSPLTGRDLLIGFNLLHQIPSLRWSSKGLMHKQHLLTWTQVPHLFTMDPFDSLKLQIINNCCASSHSEKFQFHLLGHNFLVEMDMSSFRQMQVMNIGQRLFLKKLMAKGIFMDIKVVHSSPQNSIIILLSKKFLQSSMELKNSNFIFLGTIS